MCKEIVFNRFFQLLASAAFLAFQMPASSAPYFDNEPFAHAIQSCIDAVFMKSGGSKDDFAENMVERKTDVETWTKP
jgi:hypothetical protein